MVGVVGSSPIATTKFRMRKGAAGAFFYLVIKRYSSYTAYFHFGYDFDMTILVTGGAGFIGSNFVLDWLKQADEAVINLDNLTYAGNLSNLSELAQDSRHQLIRGDIADIELVRSIFREHQPRAVIHFAAESHVDRSIHGPEVFIQTNVIGTFRLLEAALEHWRELPDNEKTAFRFLQVSTDEVFGSLTDNAPAFTEQHQYLPNSPYSASKAAADHLVRAYHHTYGLPVLTTNCSNNYGPRQFPEKLIPLMVLNAIRGMPLPVYGNGKNVRDWLYVSDHNDAIRVVLARGKVGETYNIGGVNELKNIDVVNMLCDSLDQIRPRADGEKYQKQITYVTDRPGHDFRYAMDISKLQTELGWSPKETFQTGLQKTIAWYLENADWIELVNTGEYRSL